ncbi:MAG: alpha/beta hydrolase [Opitutaceae bacterium]|jgi:acetyl esterase/lipase|nr:alpha/beta hydrolase [Opitutaceae bacterium]
MKNPVRLPALLLMSALAFAALLPAGAAPLPQARRNARQEAGMKRKAEVSDLHADIVYKKVGGDDLTLDLMLPKTKTDAKGRALFPNGTPVVFYLHGGGWHGGHRYASPDDAAYFSENGLALACVTYRFAKNNGLTIADCVTDCFDAARYLAGRAADFSLDPQLFLAYGHSAGGHLTLMMLYAPPADFPGDPALAAAKFRFVGGVSFSGPTNMHDREFWNHEGWAGTYSNPLLAIQKNQTDAFGAAPEAGRPAIAKKVSPYYYLEKNSPRTLLIHGELDRAISINHSVLLEKRARELGADVTLWRVPNADHGFKGGRTTVFDGWSRLGWGNLRDMAREAAAKNAADAAAASRN